MENRAAFLDLSAHWAVWLVSALAAVAYLFVALRPSQDRAHSTNHNGLDHAPRNALLSPHIVLLVAAVLHAIHLIQLLWFTTPRFGFATAISATAWLVVVVYLAESKMMPALRARWGLAALGVVAVLLPLLFPGSPLSKSSPALMLHLLLGVAAYAMIACAALHGWLMRYTEHKLRKLRQSGSLGEIENHTGLPVMTLERLMFAFVWAGWILLGLTLAMGWLFGEEIYGSGFNIWQKHLAHKIVFSVISWGIFTALLLGRYVAGWRSRTAVTMVYVGAACLLLAYIGSHFVTEVILNRV